MPRRMPPLGSRFAAYVDRMVAVCEAVEVTRTQSEPGSAARTRLTSPRLIHLYEAAYLRIFASWEAFLEECCVRYMIGYVSPMYSPVVLVGGLSTLADAREQLYGQRDFLLWHNPRTVIGRAQSALSSSPIETVASSSLQALEWMAAVRHRVAHDSDNARDKFDRATMGLAGRRYRGGRPGLFLRAIDGGQSRWLPLLGSRLQGLATQIAP